LNLLKSPRRCVHTEMKATVAAAFDVESFGQETVLDLVWIEAQVLLLIFGRHRR